MKTWLKCTVGLFLAALAMVSQASAVSPPVMTIGRVYSVEGDLLRYVPADKDWVAMVNDAPFGVEDTFFSGNQGRAEMYVPNGTWLRVGSSTQVQFIALDPDLSEVDVASGVARFYNKGSETVIKATSPFGYVMAYPGSAFDYYVGENSVEVVAVKGTVSFVHAATDARYDVTTDSPSILADASQVVSGDGVVDAVWHQWNVTREGFWTEKSRLTGRSVEYLPPVSGTSRMPLRRMADGKASPMKGHRAGSGGPPPSPPGGRPSPPAAGPTGMETRCGFRQSLSVTSRIITATGCMFEDSWYWAPPVAGRRAGLSLLDIGFSGLPEECRGFTMTGMSGGCHWGHARPTTVTAAGEAPMTGCIPTTSPGSISISIVMPMPAGPSSSLATISTGG